MFSKIVLKKYVSLFSLLLVVSCSYFFEEKKSVREADIVSTDAQCLTQTVRVFDDYFENLNEESTLDASLLNQVSCLKNAVEKFSSYVKSGTDDRKTYGAQEIFNVLKVFLDNENLSIDLSLNFISKTLVMKEFLIGGSRDQLTQKELVKIKKFISAFGQIFLDVRPYRKILFDNSFKLKRTEEEREHFDKAFSQLKSSVDAVLNLTQKWGSKKPLDLEKVGEFLLSAYYGDEYDNKKPYLNLYVEFKKLVLNENHSYVKRKDFEFLVHQTLKTYYSIFEYNHFIADDQLFNSLGSLASFIVKVPKQLGHAEVFKSMTYKSLERIYNRGAEILIHASRRGQNKKISMDKIEGLLKAMEKIGYLGPHLTAHSLTLFISDLASGWMVDDSLRTVRRNNQAIVGYQPYLTEKKVNYILQHIRRWQERQNFINKLTDGKEHLDLSEIKSKKLSKNIRDWLTVLKKVRLKHWIDIDSDRSEKSFRLLFSRNDQRLNYRELTVGNSIYTEALFFMQPFQSKDTPVINYALTEDQTQSIYKMMRWIGIEMAFMDSRIYDTGNRAYVEANLFTTRKTADKKLDLYEGFELMNYLYNSGMLSEEIHAAIHDDAKLKSLDVLRKKLIKPSEFREFLRKHYIFYFQQLEGLKTHWNGLSEKEKDQFLLTLEKAARGGVISDIPFDMGAIRILVAVTYYLESIFQNFENPSDQDNFAVGKELEAAEKHFHDYLHKIAEQSINKGKQPGDPDWETFKESHVDNLFYSILYYKKLPDPDSWFHWWTVGLADSNDKKIDRSDAMHIFAILADMSRKGAIQRIRKFLQKKQVRLLHEVEVLEEVPKCHKRKVLFCQWARVLQCNTDVYEHLFKQMQISSNRFSKPEQVEQTLQELADWMREDDVLLQTKCTYPHIEGEKKKEKKEGKKENKHDCFKSCK